MTPKDDKAKNEDVTIHPTAIVDPSAELDMGVSVGPYSIIGPDVKIGAGTVIGPHAVVDARTTLGKECKVFQFASVGAIPQDIAYKGEPTETVMGDRNTMREFVTIHGGTIKDKGRTVIGNGNLFMNCSHVAHDCVVGDGNVIANNATLAGHVTIEDRTIIGGTSPIHQYVRIGSYSMIGGASPVSKDIPPFVIAVGNRASLYGVNLIGLRRNGFSKEAIEEIKTSFRILFKSHMTIKEAVAKLKEDLPDSEHAHRFIEFIEKSKRGVAKLKIKSGNNDGEF